MPVRHFNNISDLEALAQSGYSKVFELLHTGIAVMSATGHFLYCNSAFLDMFNLPKDVLGKHVTDFFITGDAGVMTAIRTRKPTFCTSLTTGNEEGISFRYPLLDDKGELRGVIIESISPSVGAERMGKLLETVKSLEEKSHYFEQKNLRKPGCLYTFENILGKSDAILRMKRVGERFAKSQEPILLLGESGVGKELVAQALHSASKRSDKPFVAVNCAALPRDLMEAELFGYESGAFTGAKSGGNKGKFELANKGTIFLDEIGELPLEMQAKLLRVLESGEIQKLASRTPLHSNFRLIAATNRDLARSVEEGSFREDLYHRINMLEIAIPPLRERLVDIPLLCSHFIEQHAGPRRAGQIRIAPDLFQTFRQAHWTGNIRELKNVLTYALFNLEDNENILSIKHLPPRFLQQLEARAPERPAAENAPIIEKSPPKSEGGCESMDAVCSRAESEAIHKALKTAKYNKSVAAQILGVSRNKLYRKLKRLGLVDNHGHYVEDGGA